MKDITVLAIDTSCDETSCAVVEGYTVLSNVLPSQIEFHKKYGGVVPSVARLAHQQRIDGVVNEALQIAKKDIEQIDFVAVTIGPGLAIALEVGINKAKQLARKYKKPLITVNHMEGHLLSVLAQRKSKTIYSRNNIQFPVLGVLVSGKHTELVLMKAFGDYKIIGETQDDACGEAFDKCGRMLGLGYPAGPILAKFAKENRKNIKIKDTRKNLSYLITGTSNVSGKLFELPVAMANSKDLNFSYSGLKTAFKQLIEKLSGEHITSQDQANNNLPQLKKQDILDLCVVFEEAAFRPIEIKLKKAVELYRPKEIWLGGGVSANTNLRQKVRKLCKEYAVDYKFPDNQKLNTDNAAMIGLAAIVRLKKLGIKHNNTDDKGIYSHSFDKIDRDPTLSLEDTKY